MLLKFQGQRRTLYILYQGNNARKVNCCCAFSAYILKPVLSGMEFVKKLQVTKTDASVFLKYPRRIKAFNFENFDNSHNSNVAGYDQNILLIFYVKDGSHVRL